MTRRNDTRSLILLFAIPGILGPLSIPLLDFFMGLATWPEILDAFTLELALEPLLVAIVGIALAAFITRRVNRADEQPQAAYRAVRWGWLGVMVWGIGHNLAFSLVFHGEAAFITDPLGTAIVAIYAGAVGMYFSVITVVGALPVWERRLPVDVAASGTGRTLGMGARFFLSITITVVAFLYGTSAVVLFAVYAGHDTAFALARISLVGIPFLVITIPLVAFLARTTTGAIASAVPVLTTFSGGDLRPRLQTSAVDEISLALHHVNRFVDSVGHSLGEATEGAAESSRLASGLDEQAARQREATGGVSRRVEEVSSRVSEVQQKVDSVASATEEISRTLESLQRLIENQQFSVEETSSSAEELASATANVVEVSERRRAAARELSETVSGSVGELSGAMKTLDAISSRADNLRSLNEVITDLAARTNLLAMNAAIEAAHAGEAGKGFAVVASEIRSLAESASRSAAESTSFLDEMVRGIEASATSMRSVQGSFERVDAETTSVVGSLEEIVTAAGQMSRSASSIGTMMTSLSEANREVVSGAGQIGTGVLEINEAGQTTRELASAAAAAMAEVADELSSVAGSSDEVSRIAGTLRTSAAALEERLRRYRIADRG